MDKALDVLRANALEQRALQEKVREQNELLLQQHEKSEELLRQFVDQAPAAMLMLDRDMVHLACSRRWLELFGLDDGGMGRPHYDVFTQIPQHWKEAHRRGLAGETVCADEEAFTRPDGGMRWMRWEVRPWLTSDETIGGITIMGEDETERVLAVRALRESELRMRLAQEAAGSALGMRLADNQIRWSESSWSLRTLVRSEQWRPIVETWETLIHPADYEVVISAALRSVARGEEIEIQWRLKSPEGEPVRWFMTRGRPILGADGAPDSYFGVVIEITDQKLAVDALRESELRMRLAQETARVATWELRPADKVNVWSENLWRLLGLEPGQSEAKLNIWLSAIHPDDSKAVKAKVKKAAAEGQEFEVQYRLNRPEGEPERWLFSRGTPFAGSTPGHYFGVVIEITEQKHMEQALRESELHMRLAQEAAKAGAWEWDLADSRIQWSDSVWRLYGVQKPEQWEPTLQAWRSLVHPADRERVAKEAEEATRLGQDLEFQWRLNLPEGEPERWFLSRGRPIADQAGAFSRYVGVVIDITQQKLMEEALRESEERMRLAQEAAKVGAWEWRLSDNRLTYSHSLWSLYGVQEPEHWTPSIEGWVSIVHPADRERVIGTAIGAVTLGQDYETPWRLNAPEGDAERWFLSRGRALKGADGRPDRYFGVIIEITEQKLAEEALREADARKSFLLALNDAFRSAEAPAEAIAVAGEMLGKKLNASRIVYSKFEAADVRVMHSWRDGAGADTDTFALASMANLDASFLEALENGQTVVVGDVRSDPHCSKPETRSFLERGSVAAFIVVPLVKDRKVAGVMGVHKRDPYPWKKDEVSLAQDVAHRTWDLVERALAVQALRESEERQSFLLALNDALRTMDDPFEAIALASKMLGRKLNASQVVYAKTGDTGDRASITHEWNDGGASGALAIEKMNDLARRSSKTS